MGLTVSSELSADRVIPQRPRIDVGLALPNFDVLVAGQLHRVCHYFCASRVATHDYNLANEPFVGTQIANVVTPTPIS